MIAVVPRKDGNAECMQCSILVQSAARTRRLEVVRKRGTPVAWSVTRSSTMGWGDWQARGWLPNLDEGRGAYRGEVVIVALQKLLMEAEEAGSEAREA